MALFKPYNSLWYTNINNEQKDEIKQHIVTYRQEAYEHINNGNPHSSITEMSFIHDILDSYDPDIVFEVLHEVATGDKVSHKELEAKHDIYSNIVRDLHIMRTNVQDQKEELWAQTRYKEAQQMYIYPKDPSENTDWSYTSTFNMYIHKLCTRTEKTGEQYTIGERDAKIFIGLLNAPSLSRLGLAIRTYKEIPSAMRPKSTRKEVQFPMTYFTKLNQEGKHRQMDIEYYNCRAMVSSFAEVSLIHLQMAMVL